MNIIQQYEAEQIARLTSTRAVPEFIAGDTLRVSVKVVEGERTRVQAFEGVCIARSKTKGTTLQSHCELLCVHWHCSAKDADLVRRPNPRVKPTKKLPESSSHNQCITNCSDSFCSQPYTRRVWAV